MRKITIVIPCYNASVYIDRCIKALEKQNFKDFKVIFIDDFSTDNTIDILFILRFFVITQTVVLRIHETEVF